LGVINLNYKAMNKNQVNQGKRIESHIDSSRIIFYTLIIFVTLVIATWLV